MIGFVLLGVMLYGAVALGFRWGKQVGRGAERHAFRQQAARNGGMVFLPESLVTGGGAGAGDRLSGPGV